MRLQPSSRVRAFTRQPYRSEPCRLSQKLPPHPLFTCQGRTLCPRFLESPTHPPQKHASSYHRSMKQRRRASLISPGAQWTSRKSRGSSPPTSRVAASRRSILLPRNCARKKRNVWWFARVASRLTKWRISTEYFSCKRRSKWCSKLGWARLAGVTLICAAPMLPLQSTGLISLS